MPIKFTLTNDQTDEPEPATNQQSIKCTSNCYLDTHYDDDDYENDENPNSNLTLKSFKLPLPSLSQHMISSFENFRIKMDLNVNRSSEEFKEKDQDQTQEKENISTSNTTENGNEILMNEGNGEEKEETNKKHDSKGNLDNKMASMNKASEIKRISSPNNLETSEKDVNNNNVDDVLVTKSAEIEDVNIVEQNPSNLKSTNSKITEIWLSTEKSFPLDDRLSAESLTETDENNNDISANVVHMNVETVEENNQDQHSNAVKSTVTKVLDSNSKDVTTTPFTAPQIDVSAAGTLSPDEQQQNPLCDINKNTNNMMNYEDEETQITWNQNIPITPTPSGALLNPEDYFYNSSEESDIELMIKIPKMAFAQSVLDELSEACSTFTITSIGMPEKKKRENTAEEKNEPNTHENPETVSIKSVPKPYTNIFSPNEEVDTKKQDEKKEISQLFFNFKRKREGTTLENKNADSDSSFPNSPVTRLEDTFVEEKNTDLFYCNPDECYISPPTASFIIGVQNESRLTSKFPNYHQKFNPNRSSVPAKRSASTITEPIKDWDFWKNFVEHPPASADETQTKFNGWGFSRTRFTETQESESTKASGSEPSDPNSDEFKTRVIPNLSSNSDNVETSSTSEIQPGIENQSTSSSSSTHRALSEVSSWRKWTLSSGYSDININELEVQYDVPPGNILTAVKGEKNKILTGITKSEGKVEGRVATSETSVSSASEIIQKNNCKKPSKLRSKSKTTNNNNDCSKLKMSRLRERCPMEGIKSNVDESGLINQDNGKYLHSSSSCFSLSDEDCENETATMPTRTTVKEGVFPLIVNEKKDDQEKEKLLLSASARGHFVGDSLEKCPTDIDEKDYEYDQNQSHHPDEKKKNKMHNPLMVKKHSPTSIKSSQGSLCSLYSVGASLPPKPSVIRSSLTRSPRRGRFMKNTEGGGGNKGLITLNKVSSSTLSSKRSESVGSRSSSGFDQGEKMATMKPKFDYSKIHECDSLHLLRLSRQEIRDKKESSPVPSSNPANSSTSSIKYTNQNTNNNIKYDEQKRSRTVPRKSTLTNPHVREKLHKRIFGFFKWCQVRGS